jgi:hypothetical protein
MVKLISFRFEKMGQRNGDMERKEKLSYLMIPKIQSIKRPTA